MAIIRSKNKELVAPQYFDALWDRLVKELQRTDNFEHDTIRELSIDELRECLRRASIIPRNE